MAAYTTNVCLTTAIMIRARRCWGAAAYTYRSHLKTIRLRLDYFFFPNYFSNIFLYFLLDTLDDRTRSDFKWLDPTVYGQSIPRRPHNDPHTTAICTVYIFCITPLGRIVYRLTILYTYRCVCVCVNLTRSGFD